MKNKIVSYMYNQGIDFTYEDYSKEETKKILQEHIKHLFKIYNILNQYEVEGISDEELYDLGDVINLLIGMDSE